VLFYIHQKLLLVVDDTSVVNVKDSSVVNVQDSSVVNVKDSSVVNVQDIGPFKTISIMLMKTHKANKNSNSKN
jgi:hypothetical protein